MIKVFLVLGIAVMFVGLSFAYNFQAPPKEKAMQIDSSKFTLTDKEVRQGFEITDNSTVPAHQLSMILGQELEKVKRWRYEEGSIAYYFNREDEKRFYILISRFEDVIGAKVAFDSLASAYTHKIEDMPKLEIGRESRFLERKKGSRILLFRESNILVYIMGDITTNELKIYAEITEDKIREVPVE